MCPILGQSDPILVQIWNPYANVTIVKSLVKSRRWNNSSDSFNIFRKRKSGHLLDVKG